MAKTKENILNAASKTFAHLGFQKTSIEKIAKKAKKAKGSIYYHFISKENLFAKVIQQELQLTKEELLTAIEKETNPEKKLKKYFSKRVQLMSIAKNYISTARFEFNKKYHFLDELKNDFRSFECSTLKSILVKGVEKKEFELITNIDTLSESLIVLIKSIELQSENHSLNKKENANIEVLLNLILRGVRKKEQKFNLQKA